MIDIQEYVEIKQFSTLRVGGQFRYFSTIDKAEDLQEAYSFAKERNIKIFILGGGSNMVFSDGVINVFVLKIEIKGFEIVLQEENYTDIKVGAGENWDEIVSRTVDMGLSGLESLSAIPGTVGASPVQNIGAYGAEVKDTILEVEVYEIETGKTFSISNQDCKFGYRDSVFKHELKGKYAIINVVYRLKNATLSASLSQALLYPGVKRYFIENNINSPTLKQIRETVIDIRNSKLPNPKEMSNVGSFFKNPIVEKNIADRIKVNYSNAKFFPIDEKFTKVPAGWLIENAGLKGRSFGKVSIYDKNALVLTNTNNAKYEDIVSARDEIIKIVQDKFGITLEQEPEII